VSTLHVPSADPLLPAELPVCDATPEGEVNAASAGSSPPSRRTDTNAPIPITIRVTAAITDQITRLLLIVRLRSSSRSSRWDHSSTADPAAPERDL
jgi:hypothetical protein